MRAVNLLPPERRQNRRRGFPGGSVGKALVVGGCAVALAGAGVGYLSHSATSSVASKRDELARLQERLAALPEPAPASGRNTSTAARLGVVAAAAERRVTWDALMTDLSRVMPEDVWLLSLNAFAPGAPNAPSGGTLDPTQLPFAATGYTYTQPSVARLLDRLELVPWLDRVRLQSSERVQFASGGPWVYKFTVGGDVVTPEAAS